MDECYACVQWTSSKVSSFGIVAESECVSGNFDIGSTIEATYRNVEHPFPAKILFVGTLVAMEQKLCSLDGTYKPHSNSPKQLGKGKRVAKKKLLPEGFVPVPNPHMAPEDDTQRMRKMRKEKKLLKRKAVEDTGDQIIGKLLQQGGSPQVEDDGDYIVLEVSEDVEELKAQLVQSQEEVARLGMVVKELTEKNFLLQNQLPLLLTDTRKMLRQVARLPAFPPRPTPRTPGLFATSNTSGVTSPTSMSPSFVTPTSKPPSPQPSLVADPPSPRSTSPDPQSPKPSESSSEEEFNTAKMSRVPTGKSWGTLTCDLMSCLFSREQMSQATISAKYAKMNDGMTLLPSEVVNSVVDEVRKRFPGTDRSTIRVKISSKLRDEKTAYKKCLPSS